MGVETEWGKVTYPTGQAVVAVVVVVVVVVVVAMVVVLLVLVVVVIVVVVVVVVVVTVVLGPKRDEVKGKWRKLHNDELHNLYSSPNILRVIKSRRMRLSEHVTRMADGKGVYRVLVEKPERRDQWGDPGLDGRKILRWIFRKFSVLQLAGSLPYLHTQVSRNCRKVSFGAEDEAKRKTMTKPVTVHKALLHEPPKSWVQACNVTAYGS
jgi:ABC-type multidrug transport system fused ATPase/permease subunit